MEAEVVKNGEGLGESITRATILSGRKGAVPNAQPLVSLNTVLSTASAVSNNSEANQT